MQTQRGHQLENVINIQGKQFEATANRVRHMSTIMFSIVKMTCDISL